MPQDNELQSVRSQLELLQKQLASKARRATVGMLILVLVTVSSVIYAFTNRVEAERSAEQVTVLKSFLEEAERNALQMKAEAMRQQNLAAAAAKRMEEELELCRQGRK